MSKPLLQLIAGFNLSSARDRSVAVFVEALGVDRPEDVVSRTVHHTIPERKRVDQTDLGKIFIKSMNPSNHKILPDQMVLGFNQIIFQMGRIG